MAKLQNYDWPGNIRELRNVMERCYAVAGGPEVAPEELGLPEERPPEAASATRVPMPAATLEESERLVIEQTLISTCGNQRKAARILGIHRDTLRTRMERYGLRAWRSPLK